MLIESLSGVRAHDKELTSDFVRAYAVAFSQLVKAKRIVIGRDPRESGKKIVKEIKKALLEQGIDVIDIGVCPTPTVQFNTHYHIAQGGISVTASHNPLPWNGLKFIDNQGMFLDPEKVETLIEKRKDVENNFPAPVDEEGELSKDDGIKNHIESLLTLPYLNVDRIKEKKFKVAFDGVNGAGYSAIPQLLEELGCEVVTINCDADEEFPRDPEPSPEKLSDLEDLVEKESADIGFAVDADADRLAIVTEKGEATSEEMTLVLVAKLVLSKAISADKKIVTNLSTTRALDDIAEEFDGQVIRTPVGEINVVKTMHEENALMGGEGNGGVIITNSHRGRDSLTGVALILQLLAEEDKKVSSILSDIKQYVMIKQKVERGDLELNEEIIEKLKEIREPEEVTTSDGVKLDFEEGWAHIRESNTEPIFRIYAEGKDEKAAKKIIQPYIKFFKDMQS
ncbi:MAG: phosphoglucosamine mutase [Candidatus Marinimicrobia bacterium]|nr:phosphoglucosamine mutase [Candidatus Neomarinimicrobiota bacterium]